MAHARCVASSSSARPSMFQAGRISATQSQRSHLVLVAAGHHQLGDELVREVRAMPPPSPPPPTAIVPDQVPVGPVFFLLDSHELIGDRGQNVVFDGHGVELLGVGGRQTRAF
jgi:hypothetical protein